MSKKTERELLFSVTKDDFKTQFFRVGGKGGQNQNKVSSACRIIHKESGAVGESRNFRDQFKNKKAAFQRLVESSKFKQWHRLKTAAVMAGLYDIEKFIEQKAEQDMRPENLKTEIRTENGWKEVRNDA